MRMRVRSLSFLGSIAVAAGLTGCSGAGSQAVAPASLGPASQGVDASTSRSGRTQRYTILPLGMRGAKPGPSTRKPFVDVAAIKATQGNQTIIADVASATVTVWGGAGQLNAILFDGIAANPNGLTTDAQESLYVANFGASNVIVYPKPYTAIATTLADPGEEPLDVAVSSAGVVGVTNYLTTQLAAGSVSFFAKGSASACTTVHASGNWIYFVDDAFDSGGNLFIDGMDQFGGMLVGEISGGCAAKGITTLRTANSIVFPGGVQVYAGKILIEDPISREIFTYAAPTGGSLGAPIVTTPLNGATSPVTFVMMTGGQNVWTADFNANGAFAGKYTYPGGAAVKAIDDHISPVGVAVNPAALP